MSYPVLFPKLKPHILKLSHPSPATWVIELRNGADNRLTRNFILNAILPALDHVEKAWRDVRVKMQQGDQDAGNGALVITGNLSQNKFFSNGLNLEAALAEPGFWSNVFYPLMDRLLTYPIPVVAAINGHAFAGGWLISAACDYRVMSSGKCWASMPEIYLGSDFPNALIVFLRMKLPSAVLLRKQVLEGHRWTPQELLGAGMVDEIVEGGSKHVLEHALALAEKWSVSAKTGVYGLLKAGIHREFLEASRMNTRLVTPAEDDEAAQRRLTARARL